MKDITVTLGAARTVQVPFGTRASHVLREYAPYTIDHTRYSDNPVVAITVNNELSSFSVPLEFSCTLEPVHLFSELGRRIYRHSLCFLLAMAGSRVFPGEKLLVGHALGDGYYYTFENEMPVTGETIIKLKKTMQGLADAALPIIREFLPYQLAVKLLKENNLHEASLLLSFTNRPKIPVYTCEEYVDVSYEPLLDNTRLLEHFELQAYGGESGMLLRYPRQDSMQGIAPFKDNPALFSVFQEYKQWGIILGVHNVGKLSSLIEQRRIKPFIHVSESLHDKKISRIADQIFEKRGATKAVFIAGPSSSGKTTFTKKLGVQLKVLGFDPIMISLDDYYLPKHEVPLDDEGRPDLESLRALDVKQLNEDLIRLFRGETVDIPKYDFTIGNRKPEGKPLCLKDSSILIMEGIHGLNPELTPLIPREQKFQIYISALTQLNLDDHNRISTTDNRIIRRMVRDHQFRGTNPRKTIDMWNSVHRGEKHYIFPYQNNADAVFNSALDYELSVLKPYAEPLLKTVKPYHKEFTQARRLLAFLEHFYPIPSHFVPEHSILREFIGESAYYEG